MSAYADEYWLCDHVKPSDLEEIALVREVIEHLLQGKPMNRVDGSESHYCLQDGPDWTWWIPESFMQREPRQISQTAAPPLAPHTDEALTTLYSG
jgi:hypothetical protein